MTTPGILAAAVFASELDMAELGVVEFEEEAGLEEDGAEDGELELTPDEGAELGLEEGPEDGDELGALEGVLEL